MSAFHRVVLVLLMIIALPLGGLAQGNIFIYAGPPLPVSGTQALTQSFTLPQDVTPDGSGGFYFNSPGNHQVYRVSLTGVLAVVAGNGVAGFTGDGRPAISAALNDTRGVAVDSSGSLYISDSGNHRIRKVSPAGIINTVAGNGTAGFAGDGGPAVSASLNFPIGMAVDGSGNLYIADTGNHRIRRVSPAGIISTVAGNGSASFTGDGGPAASASLYSPNGVTADSSGNLYITDTNNHRIRRVSPAGIISTVAGNGTPGFAGDGGPATSASVNSPFSVAADSAGNFYIADNINRRIRKVSPAGIISTLAGNGIDGFTGDGGPATSAALHVRGLAFDSLSNLYFADTGNNRIRKISPSGIISTVAGNGAGFGFAGDGGPAVSSSLRDPHSLGADSSGNLYLADTTNHRIRKVSPDGIISTVAGNGTAGFSGDGGPATSASLNSPEGVAVDSSGGLYIADTNNNRIRKVTSAGAISTLAGTGTAGFSGDGGPGASASLNSPQGVAVDSSGSVYIADTNNNRIRKVTSAGAISTLAGNGTAGFSGDGGAATSASLNSPQSVAVDSSGSLYIADTNNHRIRKVTSAGAISTLAGNGTAGFSGDGGAATSASLNFPQGVAVDGSGNLYIADTNNNRIRKVTPDGIITTIVGNGTGFFSGDGSLASSATVLSPTGVAADSSGNIYIGGATRIWKVVTQLVFSHVGSFAQLASGGGWKTGFTLVNKSSGTTTARITFHAEDGSLLSLPLSFPQSGAPSTNSSIDFTIAPKGSAVVESEALTASTVVGWADVQATTSNSIDGFAIFRLRQSGVPDSEGTVTLDAADLSSFTLPYDNTSGFQTGVAIAIPGLGFGVNVTLRDDTGVVLATSQITLAPSGHTSFFLPAKVPQSANRRGVVEFEAPAGGITGLGLRFSPSLSFTSVPVIP